MKLLFDENLSPRLVHLLNDVYPGYKHVRDVGLRGASDGASDRLIWSYAAEHGFLLTSKDTDFYQRSLVHGAPPKVLYLRTGNGPTLAVSRLLRQSTKLVRNFLEDEQATFFLLRTP